jgi:hypothetical protein
MKVENIILATGIVTAAVATLFFTREVLRKQQNEESIPQERKENDKEDRDPTESELQDLVDKFKGR